MATALRHCYTHKVFQQFPSSTVTFARYATVVVDVPSTVHYPANYKIKYIILDTI
jgi:hypothetical protein